MVKSITLSKYLGKKFKTNNYGEVVIIRYNGSNSVEVQFINTGYETTTTIMQIKKGTVKDRTVPSIYGVGVVGNELVIDNLGNLLKEYKLWQDMIKRCYNSEFVQKNPTYKDCHVSENFKYYPYFKEWCNQQIGFGNEGWHLDKDILVKGNKVYSEETCCFVPREINCLLVNRRLHRGEYPVGVSYDKQRDKFVAGYSVNGVRKHLGCFTNEQEAFLVYKQAKESYIKEVAEKRKDQIDPRVYEALVSWNVEEED